jgi:hypothetical protein
MSTSGIDRHPALSDITVVRVSLLVVVQRQWFLDGTGQEPEDGLPVGALEFVAASPRLIDTGATVRLGGPARLEPGRGPYAEIPVHLTVRVSSARWREAYQAGPEESVPVYVASSVSCWSPLRHHGSVMLRVDDEATQWPEVYADTHTPNG